LKFLGGACKDCLIEEAIELKKVLKELAAVEGSEVRELSINRDIRILFFDKLTEIICLIPCHIFLELFKCN